MRFAINDFLDNAIGGGDFAKIVFLIMRLCPLMELILNLILSKTCNISSLFAVPLTDNIHNHLL